MPKKIGDDSLVPNEIGDDNLVPKKIGGDNLLPNEIGDDNLVPNAIGNDSLAPSEIGYERIVPKTEPVRVNITKAVFANDVPSKGTGHAYAEKALATNITLLGHVRVKTQSYQERAVLDVKNKARQHALTELMPDESPEGRQ